MARPKKGLVPLLVGGRGPAAVIGGLAGLSGFAVAGSGSAVAVVALAVASVLITAILIIGPLLPRLAHQRTIHTIVRYGCEPGKAAQAERLMKGMAQFQLESDRQATGQFRLEGDRQAEGEQQPVRHL
ncbi:hypothetical protein [Nonomuraea rhizosphaerae]|uniref:hypothetical protein n=1 Tax=Nonomuraea rhizosphaerae TaxID=2665663 RepID=UPI001C5D4E4E|nr:hypothetical protein [Nonomuraea rhizosphaerae]